MPAEQLASRLSADASLSVQQVSLAVEDIIHRYQVALESGDLVRRLGADRKEFPAACKAIDTYCADWARVQAGVVYPRAVHADPTDAGSVAHEMCNSPGKYAWQEFGRYAVLNEGGLTTMIYGSYKGAWVMDRPLACLMRLRDEDMERGERLRLSVPTGKGALIMMDREVGQLYKQGLNLVAAAMGVPLMLHRSNKAGRGGLRVTRHCDGVWYLDEAVDPTSPIMATGFI